MATYSSIRRFMKVFQVAMKFR